MFWKHTKKNPKLEKLFLINIFIMSEYQFNDNNFKSEVLGSDVPVFVDFWAPWCGPCQMMGPVVDELANEMADKKVKIGKVNVDECPVSAGEYNVMSVPTFLMFKGGQVVDQMVGGVSKEKLKEFISKNI